MSPQDYLATVQSLEYFRWRLAQSLEWRWWRRYLRDKSPAGYLENKRRYWHRVLDQLEWTVRRGARVADIGCGPAGVFIVLEDRQQVTALDPLLGQYENLPVFRSAYYPHVEFLSSALEDVKNLGPFQQLYCFNAINHVRDWDAGLDVLTRMAAPGTEMIISSDVHRHEVLRTVFRALPGDLLHPQQHRAEEYRVALRQRGWRIDQEKVLRQERIFEYRAWRCTYQPATP